MAVRGWGSTGGGAGAVGDGGRRRATVGSPENCVNAILATISTRVWPGRKTARRGTRLGAWNEAPGAEEGGRWRGAARRQQRASFTAGRGEEEGKQAGEDPHPKAELQWQLAATEGRRGGDRDGDRGAAAKMAAGARVCETRGGGCGFCGTEGACGGFIGQPRGPWRAGLSGGHAAAGLGSESELSLKMSPTGRPRLAARERKGRRELIGG
jgi:hypothetical protein